MTDTEKIVVLTSKLLIASTTGNTEDIKKIASELLDMQTHIEGTSANADISDSNSMVGYVHFSKKEIAHMPLRFRKLFRIEGCMVRAYKRTSGNGHINYELRYRQNGYNVYASSNDLQRAKDKFIDALKIINLNLNGATQIPTTFDDFAKYYFENFRKRKVKPLTFSNDLCRYKNHILPHFKNMPIRQITPLLCQTLLDKLAAEQKLKTKDEVFSLMNVIFKSAIAHNLITKNPLDLVINTQHERKHGKALSKEEILNLFSSVQGTKYEPLFAVALFAGLRPNEYKTARIVDDFIVAVNSKRKNGKIEYKRIPIIEPMRMRLHGITELNFPYIKNIRKQFNRACPGHIIYDLRTTFYSLCEESGILPAARDEFVGHSQSKLQRAYTDLSDEFLVGEAKKLEAYVTTLLCDNLCDNLCDKNRKTT